MLARTALAFRVSVVFALSILSSQCSSPGKDATSPAQGGTAAVSAAPAAEPEIQILCDEAPNNRKGIQITLRSNLDKEVQFSFPDGQEALSLTKRAPGVATFVYDESTKKVILETSNGTAKKGPRVVPTQGSFNPVRELLPVSEKPLRSQSGWTRKLIVGRNYGLEFSFMLSIRN